MTEETASYMIVNGCDGLPISGYTKDNDIHHDMTEDQVRALVLDIAQDNPGLLVSAYKLLPQEQFTVQYKKTDGVYVDRWSSPLKPQPSAP